MHCDQSRIGVGGDTSLPNERSAPEGGGARPGAPPLRLALPTCNSDWFKNRRLLEQVGNVTPVVFETAHYDMVEASAEVAGLTQNGLRETRRGSS